jgi:hypothetical protein
VRVTVHVSFSDAEREAIANLAGLDRLAGPAELQRFAHDAVRREVSALLSALSPLPSPVESVKQRRDL